MNIFVYLFNKYVASNLDICSENYVASEYIRIFVPVHFMISAHFCTTQDLFPKAGGQWALGEESTKAAASR